jgi:outer membrane protein assembly factor BamB
MSDRVLLMDRVTQPKEMERLLCFDATTGRQLWTSEHPVTYGAMGGYSTGPRTSVLQTIQQGEHLAFALGATGHLACYRVLDGSILWQIDTAKELGALMPQWGFSGSPVLSHGKLFVHLGLKERQGSVVAFNPSTGEVLWKGGEEAAGYCTPELALLNGASTLLQWGPEHLEALVPETGRTLWRFPYSIQYGVSIAQPLVADGLVLVAGYWHGTRTVRPQKGAPPSLVWKNETELCGIMSSPLFKDGLVYLLDKTHGLTCFRLADGHILWRDNNKLTPKDRNPQFSIVWLDKPKNLVALLNANGELIYARLTETGAEELARHQIIGKTWAHPAFVGSRVYARSDSELAAWQVVE